MSEPSNKKTYFFRYGEEFVEVPDSVVGSIQADTLAEMASLEGDDD